MTDKELSETILSQYANSPILLKLINDFKFNVDPDKDINNFYNFVFNPMTAQGFGLDIWGIIVGISRYIYVVPSGEFFGFYNPSFTPTNQVYTPFNVKPFFNGYDVTPVIPVSDFYFRKMVFAKGYANINPPTVISLNTVLAIILGDGNAVTIDNYDMTIEFQFNIPLNDIQYAIIYNSGIMPIPAGVKLLPLI